MPVINVALHKVDAGTKKALIGELTAVAAGITKVPLDRFTVFIDEFDDECIGCAGTPRNELMAKR